MGLSLRGRSLGDRPFLASDGLLGISDLRDGGRVEFACGSGVLSCGTGLLYNLSLERRLW